MRNDERVYLGEIFLLVGSFPVLCAQHAFYRVTGHPKEETNQIMLKKSDSATNFACKNGVKISKALSTTVKILLRQSL